MTNVLLRVEGTGLQSAPLAVPGAVVMVLSMVQSCLPSFAVQQSSETLGVVAAMMEDSEACTPADRQSQVQPVLCIVKLDGAKPSRHLKVCCSGMYAVSSHLICCTQPHAEPVT